MKMMKNLKTPLKIVRNLKKHQTTVKVKKILKQEVMMMNTSQNLLNYCRKILQ